MKRVQTEERHDWRQTARKLGFDFHTFGDEINGYRDPVNQYQPDAGCADKPEFRIVSDLVDEYLSDKSKTESDSCSMDAAWAKPMRQLGLYMHNLGAEIFSAKPVVNFYLPEKYWDESAYYQFTLKQIEDDIEEPTRELHEMCMSLVDKVARSEELMTQLAIPAAFHEFVHESWTQGHPHLYGRMDLAYDGKGPAKLLELNYDTPTSLYEAAAFQWVWLAEMRQRFKLPADVDQYNSIHEKLRSAFAHLKHDLGFNKPFYFSSISHSPEDFATVEYLRDLAHQVGHDTRYIELENIGMNDSRKFVDMDDMQIPYLFKLHAWEYMMREESFGLAIPKSDTLFIEPAWKSILSNKGILPLLWKEFEGHPNLLPAYFDKDPKADLKKGWVRKPFFSREGSNIELVTNDGIREVVDGPYNDAPYILQEFTNIPKFGDSYTLIGSWVVGDEPCGIGIREDSTIITKNTSRFLPHVIIG